MWKRFLGIMAAALCVLNLTVGSAFSADLVKVPTAWLDEHETFLMWYAKEKGWDKEAGLKRKGHRAVQTARSGYCKQP